MKRSYILIILRHKWYVLVAAYRLRPHIRVPLWRLLIHDWSKFLPAEFIEYRKKYTGRPYSKDKWKIAWLHHTHFNPHHPEHWVLNGKPLPMPLTYILEMIIDWHAASKSYEGHWNIQEWVDKNAREMILHRETEHILISLLHACGITWPKCLAGAEV